ncbi:Sorting nexin mvp1 [Podila epigama]|nr:Sorting nexin mvp1 [Podila epigama]
MSLSSDATCEHPASLEDTSNQEPQANNASPNGQLSVIAINSPKVFDLTPSSPDATKLQEEANEHHGPTTSSMTDSVIPSSAHLPEPKDTEAVSSAPANKTTNAVFSLFLTPEQRKMKLEAESAAVEANKTSKTRGRKPRTKTGSSHAQQSILPAPPVHSTPTKPTVPMIDPNISKTGETHRFFQEVKASSQSHTAGSSGNGRNSGSKAEPARKYSQTPRDPAFPRHHLQYHGSDTIEAINGVVARLCGLDTSSSTLLEDLDRRKCSPHDSSRTYRGWYSLRSAPDLGITAPEFVLKPRGKDRWSHWGNDRDQKWRHWSEKCHRLYKPTDQERQLLEGHESLVEYESCYRLEPNQPLWQQTLATTLLTRSELAPDTELPSDLKIGALWTEKYRPTQGSEVLGNRPNTEYLTQWLKGLEVSGWTLNPEEQSAPARKVEVFGLAQKRKASKKARRKDMSDLDDFIVEDVYDDFGDPLGYLSEDDDTTFSVPRQVSSFSRLAAGMEEPRDGHRIPPSKFDIRSNTILLSGPSGSGKTAAVYACAEESGYEVFEVSPGTRRTGKDVLGLVGEMAENHHVHVVPGKSEVKDDIQSIIQSNDADSPAPKQSGIHSFFKARPPKREVQDEEMMASSDVDIDGDDGDGDYSPKTSSIGTRSTTRSSSATVGTPNADGGDVRSTSQEDSLSELYSLLATTNPRQSLILLEEVDILFEDDKGFWASVMSLLSKSKRPVVMTCNEGFMCSSEFITSIIMSCKYDIRKSIMQLQYDAGLVRTRQIYRVSSPRAIEKSNSFSSEHGVTPSSPNGSAPTSSMKRKPQRLLRISSRGIVPASAPPVTSSTTTSPLRDLEMLESHERYAEMMSLADSYLRMSPKRIVQCYEADQFALSKDDTVGQYFPIFKQPTGSDHLDLDQEIYNHVTDGAESLYTSLALQAGQIPRVFDEFLRQVQPALEQTLSLQSLRFNLTATFDSFVPALQSILFAESISTAVPTGKRLMRSGGHLKRHLVLSDDAYSSMLSSRLPIPYTP